MNKRLVEKFFTNQTSAEETERVLDWFDTPEGKGYLQERLDIDYDLMDRAELIEMIPELDSDRLYQSIRNKIGSERKKVVIHKPDWVVHTFKAAAAILVILASTFFYLNTYEGPAEQFVEREPIHFQTNDDENREITLSDGSVVRLNKNSKVVISEDFMKGSREIELRGEAFFDVAHNPEQPFIIHANESDVEVLGTSFNVRSYSGKNNVQVAVVEGKVSFANTVKNGDLKNLSVELTKGQFGYMDIAERTIQVDDLAVENYIAWKSGWFNFKKLTMQQVCTQLNRIYDVQCSFSDEVIKDLMLTANFSNESMEKTLSVIALSLDIDYEKSGDTIVWNQSEIDR